MKSKDPIEKEETADYSLPFANPYLHTKDGGPINAADTRADPKVRQRNVWDSLRSL